MAKQQERKGNQTHAASPTTLVDPSFSYFRTISNDSNQYSICLSSADQQIKTLVVTSSTRRRQNRLHLRT